MPKATKAKPTRTARRVRMVAAKIAGKSTSSIARNEGLSRDWTARELQSNECRQILAGLVDANLQRITALFRKTLNAIEEAFEARKVAMYLGKPVDLGGDPFARLTAAKRFLELVTAGRAAPRTPDDRGGAKTLTLEELEQLYAKRPVLN